jgi:hypothetical protein
LWSLLRSGEPSSAALSQVRFARSELCCPVRRTVRLAFVGRRRGHVVRRRVPAGVAVSAGGAGPVVEEVVGAGQGVTVAWLVVGVAWPVLWWRRWFQRPPFSLVQCRRWWGLWRSRQGLLCLPVVGGDCLRVVPLRLGASAFPRAISGWLLGAGLDRSPRWCDLPDGGSEEFLSSYCRP